MKKTFFSENSIVDTIVKILQVIVCAGLAVLIIIIIRDNILASMERFPREYREAANLSIARLFLEGYNAYKLPESGPIAVNVYGFVNILLAVGITKISGLAVLNSFYMLNLIAEFVFCILLTYEVYSLVTINNSEIAEVLKSSKNCTLGIYILFEALFIITYTLTFRVGHISTVPDALGMLVSMLILMLCRRCNSNRMVVVIVLLLLLEFYIKAYFLFFALPVFLFFLLKNRKKLLMFVLSGAILGIISIIIINRIFPLYFTETIYFEFIEQVFDAYAGDGIGDRTAYERGYMFLQFVMLVKKYPVVVAVFVFLTALFFINIFVKKKGDYYTNELIYYITSFVSIFALMILGKNDGAYMSYHFQLLMPWMMIIVFEEAIEEYYEISEHKKELYLLSRNTRVSRLTVIALVFIAVASVYFPYRTFGRVALLTMEQKQAWEYVEKISIDAFDRGEDIYLGPLAGAVLMDRRDFYSDQNGHTYLTDATEKDCISVQNKDYLEWLFHGISNMYRHAANYNEARDRKLAEGKYDLVISDDEMISQKINPSMYNAEKVVLDTGYFDCEVTIYRRK